MREGAGLLETKRVSPDDASVDARFVAALAEDYAEHGRQAIETVRSVDPARYLLVMATVLFDERYAHAFADDDGRASG